MIPTWWKSCNVCFVCISRPLIKTFGIALFLYGYCKHSTTQPSLEPFEIKEPKFYRMFMSFYFTMLLMGMSLHIYYMKPVCMSNEGECLLLLSNTIVIFAGVWITKETINKKYFWVAELNKWSLILDELAQEAIIFKQLKKFSTKYFRRFILVTTIEYSQIVVIVMICVSSVHQKGIIFLPSEITLLLITFTQISIFTTISITASTIKEIMNISGNLFCLKMEHGTIINDCIGTYKKYLWSACYTWKSLNKIVNSSTAICMICYVAMMILNIYSLIILSQDKSVAVLFVSWYRVLSVSVILVYTVNALDQEGMVSITFELIWYYKMSYSVKLVRTAFHRYDILNS